MAVAKEPTVRSWLDGPVRYIVTPDEAKQFKALKTDPERSAFIERFWRRRDPTPATLVNEYRQTFWQRVQEANEKFVDSAGPGWRTDRGKIYILYGPPDEMHEDPTARTQAGDDAGSGLVRWVYRERAGKRKDVDPDVVVPFVRNLSGEYKLSYDPELASPFLNPYAVEDRNTAGLSQFLAEMKPTGRDPLGVMLDLGKLQEVPPQEQILLLSVESTESFLYEPLPLRIDRFTSPTGDLVAVATIAIPASKGADVPTILARFSKPGSKEGAHILAEGSFRVDGEGEQRLAQGRVSLPAAPWDVTVLAVDPASGANRMFHGRVDPLPAEGLTTSDLVLASALAPLPYAVQASYTDPYIVGGFRVTPSPRQEIRRGTPVRTYFEIYRGTEPFHVVYQLEGQEDDGRWRPLGRPQDRQAEGRGQGFELPTSPSWPLGSYRLQIHVEDAGGAAVDRQIPFVLSEK